MMDSSEHPGHLIYRPQPHKLTGGEGIGLRDPPRPPNLRQKDYEKRFDYYTVWYDCFWNRARKKVVLIGPPLLNLLHVCLSGRFGPRNEKKLKIDYRDQEKVHQIWIEDYHGSNRINFENNFYNIEMEISENRCALFKNLRALLTISKNNRLEWIRDWVTYHVKAHGANAVLLYDNSSDQYSCEDIIKSLSEVSGLNRIVVVEWPFPFGAPGGGNMPWDSNFAQLGAFEHAHHLFLSEAHSVAACDIDELILEQNGKSVFNCCQDSLFGCIYFSGSWVYPDYLSIAADLEIVRHHHHRLSDSTTNLDCPRKWVIIPYRMNELTQWAIHTIIGSDFENVFNLQFRHFYNINTSWKYDRKIPPVDISKLSEDISLSSAFRRIGW